MYSLNMTNFDKYINRSNTGAIKWDIYKDKDILPMWVADMDFVSPIPVIEALQKRINHGVFGYTWQTKELVDVICERMLRLYNWTIQPEWIVWLPGLVSGLNVACRAVGKVGDNVVSAIPIYPPFLSAPKNVGRSISTFFMKRFEEFWEIDYDAFTGAIKSNSSLFLLCNPHNPLGRIFTRIELEKLAAICENFNLIICSDEIHCDLLLDQNKHHIPTATLSPEIAKRTITLMAASKTYNIAGLGLSFAIISNKKIRDNFEKAMNGIVPHPNLLGYTATLAAYKYGENWLADLLCYLRQNRDIVCRRICNIPGLSTTFVEATYLAWIDATGLNVKDPYLFFEESGVGLSNGREFGAPNFVRLNFGCPRSIMNQALDRMEEAVKKI